jgi:hypothetical protein
MLKKAGIVVAVAAAGLAALTPLAFASNSSSSNEHGSNSGYARVEVDYTNIERDNQDLDCEFENNQATPAVGGLIGNLANLPIGQIPVLSCNNLDIEDVVDVNSNEVELLD